MLFADAGEAFASVRLVSRDISTFPTLSQPCIHRRLSVLMRWGHLGQLGLRGTGNVTLLCAMSGLSFTGSKSQRCGYPSRLCFFALHPKAEPPIRRAWKKQRLELQVSRLGELRVLVIRPCEADFPRNQKLPCRKTAQRSAPVPLTVRAGPTLAVRTWCCDNALPLES